MKQRRFSGMPFMLAAAAAIFLFTGCPNPLGGGGGGGGGDDGGGGGTPQVTAAPSFSPTTGTYGADIAVMLASETDGATIYFTTDGSEPTTGSAVYTAPIPVAGNGTVIAIRAFAAAAGFSPSAPVEAVFTIDYGRVSTPQFDPPAGTYGSDIAVSISTMTAGATIHYTTDGNEPTTASPVFDPASPIAVAGSGSSRTIRALAVVPGLDPSTVADGVFIVDYPDVATPTFSPAPGTYTNDQLVSLSTTTAGATIYYTTDGQAPTTGSPVYSTPIAVAGNGASATIKALAVAPGFDDSAVAEGTLTVAYAPAATPTVTEPPRPWVSGRRWWLESSPGATIYYTTNNSAPLDVSGNPTGAAQVYNPTQGVQLTTPDTGPTTHTIRAAATGAGYLPSAELSQSFEVIPGRVLGNLSGPDFGTLVRDLPEGLTVTWRQDTTIQFVPVMPRIRVRQDLIFDAGGFDVVFDYGFTSASGGIHIMVGDLSAINVPDPSVQATLIMRGITIRDFATQFRGGAVRVNPGSTFIAQNVQFDGNVAGASPANADSAGGAIANEGTLVVEDSVFVGNRAPGGGAIANFSGGTATIRRSRFLGNSLASFNSATQYISGGAILAIGGTVNVVDSFFAGNESDLGSAFGAIQYGGALSAFDGTINVQGSQFAGNTADVGAAVYLSDESTHSGSIRISSSAFYDNSSLSFNPNIFDSIISAGVAGGTVAARLDIRSSTIVDNTPFSINGSFSEPPILAPNLLVINTTVGNGDFQNSFVQTGVNTADIFVALPDKGPDNTWGTNDDVAGDFRLRSSADPAIRSGVINAGASALRATDFADADGDGNTGENEPLDLAGNSRVQGGTIDIGAVEH